MTRARLNRRSHEVPFTSRAVDASVTRVAICRPELVVDMDHEAVWYGTFRAIFLASQQLYTLDRPVTIYTIMDVVGRHPDCVWQHRLAEWRLWKLDTRELVDVTAIAESQRLFDLRRRRYALMQQVRDLG